MASHAYGDGIPSSRVDGRLGDLPHGKIERMGPRTLSMPAMPAPNDRVEELPEQVVTLLVPSNSANRHQHGMARVIHAGLDAGCQADPQLRPPVFQLLVDGAILLQYAGHHAVVPRQVRHLLRARVPREGARAPAVGLLLLLELLLQGHQPGAALDHRVHRVHLGDPQALAADHLARVRGLAVDLQPQALADLLEGLPLHQQREPQHDADAQAGAQVRGASREVAQTLGVRKLAATLLGPPLDGIDRPHEAREGGRQVVAHLQGDDAHVLPLVAPSGQLPGLARVDPSRMRPLAGKARRDILDGVGLLKQQVVPVQLRCLLLRHAPRPGQKRG
mmetsp:Transcript_52713/g.165528  ORF Transcript_52713/g.165528 Transcript_52713/m.165528 type:complete len:333 (-) Transcript_52713:458-1456(-)